MIVLMPVVVIAMSVIMPVMVVIVMTVVGMVVMPMAVVVTAVRVIMRFALGLEGAGDSGRDAALAADQLGKRRVVFNVECFRADLD
jgi:hypothetical protein